jgi:pyruvate ferredoxin oxidoreductase alpha subunit
VGLIKVRSFRPFPGEEIRRLATGAGALAVFDRAISFGNQGVLATDIKSALYGLPSGVQPLVMGTVAGFGGREVTLETVRGIVTAARRALEAGSLPPDEVQFVGLKPELLPDPESIPSGFQG